MSNPEFVEAVITKALSLAFKNAGAHMVFGMVQLHITRASGAIRECDRALEPNRNLAGAHAQIGNGKIYPLQVLHQALGDDRRYEFICVVDALAPIVNARRMGSYY